MIKKTHAHALHNLVFIGLHRDLLDSSFTHYEYLELVLLAFSQLFILIEGSSCLFLGFQFSLERKSKRKAKQKTKQNKKKEKGQRKIEARMEILSTVVAKIAVLFVEPTVPWLCYWFKYDSNIDTMQKQEQILRGTRDSVQNSVDSISARRNGEEIEARVATWLKKVSETIEEARKVLQVEERGQTRCSIGACQNLKVRH
jgi:Tfp pilus assembly protein PilO